MPLDPTRPRKPPLAITYFHASVSSTGYMASGDCTFTDGMTAAFTAYLDDSEVSFTRARTAQDSRRHHNHRVAFRSKPRAALVLARLKEVECPPVKP